jgi:hypothetical protein
VSKARDLANAGTALTSVSATELGYLDGVSSAVQTQINSKIGQSTAINPSTVTTKGDILVATGSGTIVRQGVGSNGQVLTADSAEADGIKWATPAGGQLQEVAITSSNASYTIPTGVTGFWALVVGGGGGGGGNGGSYAGGGGGGGQILETYFSVSGDTTLNITIGSGGAGGSNVTAGVNGGNTTIVGNTSSTTYASAIGGGGGGNGGINTGAGAGATGASGGGEGTTTSTSGGGYGGGGGGFRISSDGTLTGSARATTRGVTGFGGGNANQSGIPIPAFVWNRQLSTGGPAGNGDTTTSIGGNGFRTAANVTPTAATANSGSGGAGHRGSSAGTGGAGGSGLVVLRYVG